MFCEIRLRLVPATVTLVVALALEFLLIMSGNGPRDGFTLLRPELLFVAAAALTLTPRAGLPGGKGGPHG